MYYVYIITNSNNTTLYVGMTNNLERRIQEHKQELTRGFSSRYSLHKLVYHESLPTSEEAIAAEKKLKWWTRKRKIGLIQKQNPIWKDLSEGWFE